MTFISWLYLISLLSNGPVLELSGSPWSLPNQAHFLQHLFDESFAWDGVLIEVPHTPATQNSTFVSTRRERLENVTGYKAIISFFVTVEFLCRSI